MTSAKWPRKYVYDSTPSVFRVVPTPGARLTDGQKAAIASRMAKVLHDDQGSDEASGEDAKTGGSKVDRT